MAIKFRHDAAAVVPPSNESTRKYGQNLVLQQQQQKYNGLQAGYDRLFTLGRDNQQNQFQMERADKQNKFQLARDEAQFGQQQQVAEAERQRRFMEEARQNSSRFILEDIENGEYDPATSRNLKQNLVAEAEALGSRELDATQRAEVLRRIRADRAVLLANRIPKAPPPTAQQQFSQGIVTDPKTGMRYRANSKGDYEPIPEPEQPQQPLTTRQQFLNDPKLADKWIAEVEADLKGNGLEEPKPISRKEKYERAMQLYEEQQAAFSEPSINPDTGKPFKTGDFSPVPPPPPQDSGLGGVVAGALQAGAGMIPGVNSVLGQGQPEQPITPQIPTPAQAPTPMPAPGIASLPADTDRPVPLPQPTGVELESGRNPWAEVTGGEVPVASQPAPTAQPPQQGSVLPKAPKPDFGKLVAIAEDEADRFALSTVQGMYAKQPPDIQNAINVLLNPDSREEEADDANAYLKSKGVDLEKLTAPPKPDRRREYMEVSGIK